MAEFLHTMIRVQDLDKTIEFFNMLGLVERRRKEVPEGRFTLVFMACCEDFAEIELTYNWDGEENFSSGCRNFGHLAFRVDNIYSLCQYLQDNGVIINRPPRDGHMAFVKTPDNISVELLQKGDALEPKEPWASMKNTGSW